MIAGGTLRLPRRRDAHMTLVRDLLARLPNAALDASASEPWASITFNGTRHVIMLDCPDAAGIVAAKALSDAEFTLRGHLVADITAEALEGGRLLVSVLTVEEA